MVTCDWAMPMFGGAAALAIFNSFRLEIPFIVVSGTVTEELAVRAMRSGARDWVVKDKLARLAPAIERELQEGAERLRNAEALRSSEDQLRQSQKMEAIGVLAAGVAHDFNNLLSVILGHADFLHSDLGASDGRQESVAAIKGAGTRAAALARQLLALSRQQILQPRIIDLNETVAGMANVLRPPIAENVELTMIAQPSLRKVMVDPVHVERVILNLVVNARDAMPDGGKLTIETENVELDETYAATHLGVTPGAHVMVAVSDTGIGMDDALQARIFEPFFTTKVPGSGTGLGLATVLGIVEQSGGTISTNSEPGRGTTFKVYLPSLTPSEAAAAKPAERPPTGARILQGSETILLVEDDRDVRILMRMILERHGYDVLDARDGREALLISETTPRSLHLLVTDVVMPRMGGRDLSERLLMLRPALKVLYVSGHAAAAIKHIGVSEPGVAFLQKPIESDVFLRTVRDVLDSAAGQPIPSAIASPRISN